MTQLFSDETLAHYNLSYDDKNSLSHFGVPGMKWGVRKQREVVLTKRFKSGEILTITKDPPSGFVRTLSKVFPGYKKERDKTAWFTFTDKTGKKVGEAFFYKKSPTSLSLEWVSVRKSARGNGYASAAMAGVIKYAKKEGLTKLTLEVPGSAPDALHIYEKLGFIKVDQISSSNDIWGGLTSMEMDLSTIKHTDDLSAFSDELAEILYSIAPDYFTFDRSSELSHFGVSGMKWGIVKKKDSSSNSKQLSTVKKPMLSTHQKKVIAGVAIGVGAAVVIGLLARKRLLTDIDSGRFQAAVVKGKNFWKTQMPYKFKTNFNLANRNLTPDEIHNLVVKPVNPGWAEKVPGTRGNCLRAAYAFELRRRGYDVVATSTKKGIGQSVYGSVNAMSPNKKIIEAGLFNSLQITKKNNPVYAKLKASMTLGGANRIPIVPMNTRASKVITTDSPSNAKIVFDTLVDQPNGSRGNIFVSWLPGGNHAMSYEIINNKPVIFDAQTGRTYQTIKEFRDDCADYIKDAAFTRLDNLDLNLDFLMRWVKDAA